MEASGKEFSTSGNRSDDGQLPDESIETSGYKNTSYLSKAFTLSEQINDKSLQKEVYTNLGSVYCKSGMLDTAVELYLKLQKILIELGKRKEEADTCILLGDIFQEMEQYEKAIKSYQSAINIGKKLEEKEMQMVASQKLGRLYSTLASVSSRDGDYNKATRCYQKSLNISGTEPIDDQMREQALIGLGEAWLNLQSNEEAMQSIEEPENAAKKEVDPGEYYLINMILFSQKTNTWVNQFSKTSPVNEFIAIYTCQLGKLLTGSWNC